MRAPATGAGFYSLVEPELDHLRRRLLGVGRGAHPTFAAAATHLFGSPGKLLRPTLVFLSARFGPASGASMIVDLAESLELVHTASLVHDDIVDEADVRRNVPTVNAVWTDDVALIVGDYLFAKAYALAAVLPKPEVIAMVAQTVFALCDGELAEVAAPARIPTEAEYLERIELKTASLYAACCQGAALLADAEPGHVAALGASAELRDLLRTIRSSGGVARARTRAAGFHDAALAALDRLPARPERDALAAIAEFVVARER
ncbi:MAG: polyprenyl synthetase family protein [Chloroflexi bacterium]|nr:polyprenyl synthetase family protein [Chloroflexota bacterium]